MSSSKPNPFPDPCAFGPEIYARVSYRLFADTANVTKQMLGLNREYPNIAILKMIIKREYSDSINNLLEYYFLCLDIQQDLHDKLIHIPDPSKVPYSIWRRRKQQPMYHIIEILNNIYDPSYSPLDEIEPPQQ